MTQRIVKEVFKKAEEECASKAKTALSKHISQRIEEKFNIIIHKRTLLRSYDKYILQKKNVGSLTAENVNVLCKYLGYENYAAYKSTHKSTIKITEPISGIMVSNSPLKLIVISSIVLLFLFFKGYEMYFTNENTACMVWEKTKYVEISCNKTKHPKYGTMVIPLDKKLMENMKKVVLKRSDIIFSPEGKPLYWYCKVKPNKVEFFTSPGIHPTNGKTLKVISKVIFEKYVPIHINNKADFVNSTEE